MSGERGRKKAAYSQVGKEGGREGVRMRLGVE